MDILTYVLAGAFVGAFIAVVMYLVKKQNEETAKRVAALTEEQKELLQDVQITDYDAAKLTWTQRAMVFSAKPAGSNMALKVMWYNVVIRNNTADTFCTADVKISAADYTRLGLKEGTWVRLHMDAENSKATIVG